MPKRGLKQAISRYLSLLYDQKLFNDKKSAFIAALTAPSKRVGRMVANVGFAKTVNGIFLVAAD